VSNNRYYLTTFIGICRQRIDRVIEKYAEFPLSRKGKNFFKTFSVPDSDPDDFHNLTVTSLFKTHLW